MILLLCICTNIFSAGAIYLKSNHQSNKTNTDIRILAENLALINL